MTEYQIYAVLISLTTAIGGSALIYFVTGWMDRRERKRRHTPAE